MDQAFLDSDAPAQAAAQAALVGRAAEPPLIVDLDGTLLNSDMLAETFFALAAERPVKALAVGCSLVRGRAVLKRRLAEHVDVDLSTLPWNEPFLAYLRRERDAGRRIYLASASAKQLVDRVASYHGLFDGTFGSEGKINLKSANKAAALVAAFGERGFDYAGNESADFAVWEHARRAIAVNTSPPVAAIVRRRWPDAAFHGDGKVPLRVYARALRVHQWLKNVLVFVPALGAHRLDEATMVVALVAFLSFSLAASSVYVLNDLVDLGRDRQHARKRNRPFAAGRISPLTGLVMIPALLGAAFVLGLAIRPGFLLVLCGYYVLTLAYSLVLKRHMMIDVVALACLYGARLVGGSVATEVELSQWLGAFSLFIFVSLALVKRCAELVGRAGAGAEALVGRAYRTADLPLLEAMAAASGFTAVLVLALYVDSAAVIALYGAPHRLWLICVILIYWLGRVLMLTHRAEMHDDPVVFASTDRVSYVCILLAALILLVSL